MKIKQRDQIRLLNALKMNSVLLGNVGPWEQHHISVYCTSCHQVAETGSVFAIR
jgi:hypothetical protein